jgi:hydroxymethylbilane synthase
MAKLKDDLKGANEKLQKAESDVTSLKAQLEKYKGYEDIAKIQESLIKAEAGVKSRQEGIDKLLADKKKLISDHLLEVNKSKETSTAEINRLNTEIKKLNDSLKADQSDFKQHTIDMAKLKDELRVAKSTPVSNPMNEQQILLVRKELETAMQEGRADLAVHSLKDVPMVMPEGFELTCVMAREDARDAFVSNDFDGLEDLPNGAVVGTSSLRRESILKAHFPHLVIEPLRGNLDTRLGKLDKGQYQAIILAAAGLKRLGLEHRIRALLPLDKYTPAAGQGALGIETLAHQPNIKEWLKPLNDLPTLLAVSAERMISRQLGGSCEVPLAAHALWENDQIYLNSYVASIDGLKICRAQGKASVKSVTEAEALGLLLAQDLLGQGAADLIQNLPKVK